MYAVRRSSPPKQMLVVRRSGIGTKRGAAPLGERVVMPPSMRVAMQTSPCASTASESNRK